MQRQHILLVDDHVIVRESLAMLLELRLPGLALWQAGSVAEALAALVRHPGIDLVLLDLDLPDSRGLATLDRLRDAAPHLPVVVLSAHDGPEAVEAAIDRGAAGYLCKTVDAQRLTAAVQRVAGGGVVVPMPEALVRSPAAPAVPMLSERQRDVLRLLVEGKPNKSISRELDITEATVKTHLQAVFRRLEVSNRTQAVMAVARLGLML